MPYASVTLRILGKLWYINIDDENFTKYYKLLGARNRFYYFAVFSFLFFLLML